VVPHGIKGGEKLSGRAKHAEAFEMEGWRALAFAGLRVAPRYLAGDLTLVQGGARPSARTSQRRVPVPFHSR